MSYAWCVRAELSPLAQGVRWSPDRPGAALKELGKENGRLRKVVSDLTLDKLILKEALEGNHQAPPVAGSVSIIFRPNWASPNAVLVRLSANTVRPSARCPAAETLTAAMIRLAAQYGRCGYHRITALLRAEGWHVNAKRVQRIWRREGLKVPQKQPKKGRLWLNDGSCIRLRPCWPSHVWSYDFVEDRTHDGRKFRMLTVIDEFTRRCLAIHVDRKFNSDKVLHCLTALFARHRPPDHIRSDNGSEFTAIAVREWLGRIG